MIFLLEKFFNVLIMEYHASIDMKDCNIDKLFIRGVFSSQPNMMRPTQSKSPVKFK